MSHCGYREKEGQAYIPSGSHFLCIWLYLYEFVLSVCLWAESLHPAMKMVWSHISLAKGLWDSVGIPHFLLLLLLIEKHNLLGLGCENKNENTWAVVINWGERKAVAAWFGGAGFPSLTSVRFCLKRIVIPHTMTWLCPLAEGGKEEKGETGLHYVLHSATQSPPRSRLCSITVRQTSCTPPPHCCPLK